MIILKAFFLAAPQKHMYFGGETHGPPTPRPQREPFLKFRNELEAITF